MKYVELSSFDVALAAALIVINGLISVGLGLRLERALLIASIRTIVQLALIGLLLESVFAASQWYVVLALITVMTVIAGISAVGRTERSYRGCYADSLIAMFCSSWFVVGYTLLIVIPDLEPWYQPQYAIPLAGMILGNTLNGIALGMNRLREQLSAHRDEVETCLALGGTRWEAAQASVRQAVSTGMIPIINSMMVVGIVSLPGMMTGQLLSGVSPLEAVRYQIVIMFLIAAATAMGTVGVVLLGYRRMFNSDHQFVDTYVTTSKSRHASRGRGIR